MDMGYYKKYGPVFGSWSIVREVGSCSIGKVFEIECEGRRETLIAACVVQSEGISGCCADQLQLSSFADRAKVELELMKKLDAESGILGCKEYQIIRREGGWDILIRTEFVTPLPVYANERSLSQEEVAKLGVDICKALELCAKHNIVHGGITPDNIFVSASGEYKLGDLGLGASVYSSIEYTAPEVIKGETPDSRADLYSLGVAMYQCLNKNPLSWVSTARRMENTILPTLPDVNAKLMKAVLKASAFAPSNRYTSAIEMRKALSTENEPAPIIVPSIEEMTIKTSFQANENELGGITKETTKVKEWSSRKDRKFGKSAKLVLLAGIMAIIAVVPILVFAEDTSSKPQSTANLETPLIADDTATPTATTSGANDSIKSSTKKPKTAKWTAWSDWGDEEIEPSGTVEVEKRTIYVYHLYRYNMQYGKIVDGRVRMNMCVYVNQALINEQGYTQEEAKGITQPLAECTIGSETYENAAASIAPYGFSLVYETKTVKVSEPLELTSHSEVYMTTVDDESWFSTSDTMYGTETQFRSRNKI